MSVLVTGGAGYIGSHMVHALLDAGEQAVVVDNLSTGFRQAVPARAVFAEGDAGDMEFVSRLIRDHAVNAVIHFAGSVVVPDSVADPLGYYLNNTVKSRALIECAVREKVKHFIFSSTAAVYGMPERNPVFEDAALKPMSPYGTSKLMTELMLRDAARAHDLEYVALRYFNVAGADPKGRCGQATPRATHLVKVAVETALGKRKLLQVFGTDYPTPDGTCIRDYIHVTDLIAAHAMALDHLRRGGESQTLNCGYGKGYSVLEVVEAVKKAAGAKFKVEMAARRPGDPAAIVAGADRIRKLFGWRPRHDDLGVIVADALAWEKKLDAFRKAS